MFIEALQIANSTIFGGQNHVNRLISIGIDSSAIASQALMP
jgi:hypothetical protein